MLGTRIGWRTRWPLAAALAAAVTLASCATSAGQDTVGPAPARRQVPAGNLIVTTAEGRLRGQAAGTVDEFLGVPYAAPPVGRLRWRAPQPAAHWNGVRAATQFGPHCPQYGSKFGTGSMSENCLFLNIYTPSHVSWPPACSGTGRPSPGRDPRPHPRTRRGHRSVLAASR